MYNFHLEPEKFQITFNLQKLHEIWSCGRLTKYKY